MKMKLALAIGLLAAGGVQAQDGPSGGHQPSPEVKAFCSAHAQDCADLRTLRESAHSACANDQSTVGTCKQAREQVQAKLKTLESEGFPAPHHGFGEGHGNEGAGGPPPG